MSENLDFGAKSVLRAHLLKKEYISSPFNFTHVTHVGLDTLNLDTSKDQTFNNKPISNYHKDMHDEAGNLNDNTIHTRKLSNMATDKYQIQENSSTNKNIDKHKGELNSNVTKRIHHSKTFPKFNFKLTKDDISRPFDFVHVSHVGLDDIFDNESVKCETINMIIKEAGVTRRQLEDPETRKFITDFLKSHRKSIIDEQEKMHQPFERIRSGVSASFRDTDNSQGNREGRHKLTRHLSLNEHNFDRTTVIKPIPPKKPPRLSIRKPRENNE